MTSTMDVSTNSLEHLMQWKQEIEDMVKHNESLWDEYYPLYSIISFWCTHKKRPKQLITKVG